jgi:hypothetical protein
VVSALWSALVGLIAAPTPPQFLSGSPTDIDDHDMFGQLLGINPGPFLAILCLIGTPLIHYCCPADGPQTYHRVFHQGRP